MADFCAFKLPTVCVSRFKHPLSAIIPIIARGTIIRLASARRRPDSARNPDRTPRPEDTTSPQSRGPLCDHAHAAREGRLPDFASWPAEADGQTGSLSPAAGSAGVATGRNDTSNPNAGATFATVLKPSPRPTFRANCSVSARWRPTGITWLHDKKILLESCFPPCHLNGSRISLLS